MSEELSILRAFIAAAQAAPLISKSKAIDNALQALMDWAESVENRVKAMEEKIK